ncbi:MAG TPA: hypothetical protein VFR12_01110 [Pyrinomonadaceae bacterium]|nr:hypothetical protein [Pyrinomonadaceae bacterium]
MKSRHLTFVAVVSTVAAMFAVSYVSWLIVRFPGDRGPVYDTWGSANETFQVRMTAYREVGIMMPGAFYTFESAPLGSDEWREVKSFRGDDAIPLRTLSERFRFVNANTAYFYTSGEFFLTRDGGRNWSAWHPYLPEPDGTHVSWAIMNARVESNGTGKAYLWRYDETTKGEAKLQVFTRDYGWNWAPIVSSQR